MARRRRSSRWGQYVPVAERRAKAERRMQKLMKAGCTVQPIHIEGRKIATSFWGQSWCLHLESFSDYENRLPRGRTYARNGSVCHLEIQEGLIQAMVMGSSLYEIQVRIKPLAKKRWQAIKKRCAGQIASLLELLQGSLSDGVMEIVTDHNAGLFPKPSEIELGCNCPDWAYLCKHLAAVLYGVGARLDESPELLFLLRGVDHRELIAQDAESVMEGSQPGQSRRIGEDDLSDIFGLEMVEDAPIPVTVKKPNRPKAPRSDQPLQGSFVRDLRLWLGMTHRQFAQVVTVSPATIHKWESQRELSLRARSEVALRAAIRLSKKKAWGQLTGS